MSSPTEPTTTPISGYLYEVQKSDSAKGLSGMAAKAYGNGRLWRKIWKANKDRARKWFNPTTGEYELNPNRSFWPGDVIIIPGDKALDDIKEQIREDVSDLLPADDDREITLVIDDEEINLVSAKATLSMDTATDGFTAVTPFNPDNILQRELFRPYAYHNAELYIGGRLAIRGTLYTVGPAMDDSGGRRVTLEGWSLTADIVDSGVRTPREFKGYKLEALARELVEPLDIEVVFDVDEDKKFTKVKAESSDTIFTFLSQLAKQRSIQLSSTPQGRLLFAKAATDSEPVANLVEGYPPIQTVSGRFDGRARFNSYTAQGQAPGRKRGKIKTGTAIDDQVPRSRFRFFSADDADAGDLEKAAAWERNKALVDALTIPMPVTNIYSDPESTELWKPNTLVSLTSPTLMLPENGFTFLIRSVEYIFEDEGVTAILNLVPPQTFTGDDLPEIWSVNNG
jgi:prophage tail gpP-like protein